MTATRNGLRSLAALVLGVALAATGGCDLAAMDFGDPLISAAPPQDQPRATAEAPPPARPSPQARATPDGGTGTPGEAEFAADLRTAESVVDGFWRTHWQELFTGDYRRPTVRGLYDGRDPAGAPVCANERLEPDNAAYCPSADFLAWDVTLMRTGYARGDSWVYLVIAHEWGHAVQNRLRRGLVSAAAELQADCLAGAALYGAAADGTLAFEPGDAEEIVRGFRVIGDDVPWTRPGDHGSAAQRLRAFSRGGDGGVKSCFT
ncbi:neutral zinc metallopeptidase [Actinomadura sp. 9N407]|uniref:neutral zinc metallopeptidase n=1 Tax=Actinomadura sp. 9N407 TaxID=3375154 RepID=UPI0037A8926F